MTACACILVDEGQVLEDQHLVARDDTAIATWGVSRWPERKLMEWSLNSCNTSDLDFFECWKLRNIRDQSFHTSHADASTAARHQRDGVEPGAGILSSKRVGYEMVFHVGATATLHPSTLGLSFAKTNSATRTEECYGGPNRPPFRTARYGPGPSRTFQIPRAAASLLCRCYVPAPLTAEARSSTQGYL